MSPLVSGSTRMSGQWPAVDCNRLVSLVRAMFRGRYEHTLDSKGRVSFPATYRDVLEEMDDSGEHTDEVVLTHALDGNLDCYPVQRWRAFEERLQELSSFKREVKHVKRLYIGSAQACSIDGNGRLLVPKSMREYAGLDRDVVWVGVGEKVELWSAADWSQASSEALADVDSVGETLTELGL